MNGTGTIKALLLEKGFGFITREGEERDIYFNFATALKDIKPEELKVGDAVNVEFTEGENGKGPAATSVTRA